MIIQVVPLRRLPLGMMFFDYESSELMATGQIVRIRFGNKLCLGLVWSSSLHTTFKGSIKSIEKIITSYPLLTATQLVFGKWLSDTFQTPIGMIFTMLLPPLQVRELGKIQFPMPHTIKNNEKGTRKLVTYGDASTAYTYIKKVVGESSGSVCILVPRAETISSLISFIPEALRLESSDSEKHTREVWQKVRSGEKCVVIGTRSAIFLPFDSATTYIVFDEEYEGHKQWEGQPLYRVHEIVEYLHRFANASVYYVSRTPQVATLLSIPPNDRKSIVKKQEMNAEISFVDMGNERKAKNFSMLSGLASTICAEVLEKGGNVVLLGSRKGYAHVVECPQCGTVIECPLCFLPLTVANDTLVCRFCKNTHSLASSCAKCGSQTIRFKSGGNEMLEENLRATYPHTKIIRFEANSDKNILKNLESTILIGTDALIPYLNVCNPGLITVIDADADIRIPDYHNVERTLSRLVALRYEAHEHTQCQLIIQTRVPRSDVMRASQSLQFGVWYTAEKEVRKSLHLPPYSTLIKIILESPTAGALISKLGKELREKDLEVMVYPLLPERVGNNERYGLLIKANPKKWETELAQCIVSLPMSARIDINPISVI